LSDTLRRVTKLDDDSISQLVEVLSDGLTRSENTKMVARLDLEDDAGNEDSATLLRNGLVQPSAEDQFFAEEALREEWAATHSLPLPTDEDWERPNDHGRRDRYFNIMGELFKSQEQFVGVSTKEPFTTVHTMSQWFILRCILVGYNKVLGFHEMLRSYFPDIKLPDWKLMKRIAREPVEETFSRHGRLVTEWVTPLDNKDPQAMVAALYAKVPGLMALVGEMTQLYCDVVRATKPVITATELPDVDRPNLRADGFKLHRNRIFNCYRVVQNKHMVARAFGVAKGDMALYLDTGTVIRRRGRGRPKGSPNRRVA
jgi:hypothetical protein